MTETILAKPDYDYQSEVNSNIIDLVKRESKVNWLMAMRDSFQHNALQYYINYAHDLEEKSYWLKRVHESHRMYFYLSKYVCGTSREQYNQDCMILLNNACYSASRCFDYGSSAYKRLFQLLTKQNAQLEPYYKSIADRKET